MTGSGFPPGSPLAAELFSDPVQLHTTPPSPAADASGRFRIVVTIPAGTSPGLHTLRVRAVGGTAFANASVLVTAPAPGLGVRTQTLSRTGGEFARRAILALALMATGFVLLGLAWNDRRPRGHNGRRSPWADGWR